ncbi:MAG: DNA-binding domain-containing protein [Burkholderiales bacterium]|nr:DNA-binding domain-containing protein [Burkholderiales bacterium]
MIGLEDLQRQFQQFVLGGDVAILLSIEDGPRSGPGPRLAIYHEAYRIRLRSALADTFGTLRAHLGAAAFDEACARYVEAAPSTVRNIRWFGAGFADFLRSTQPYDRRSWLTELATFDWTLAAAFDASDAPGITVDDLTSVRAEALAATVFTFHPSVRLLNLSTNAPLLRMAADRDEPLPAARALDAPTGWLVWRRDFDTNYRSLDEVEAAALEAACGGATFAQICAQAAERLGAEQAPSRAAWWLRQWIDDGLIVRLEV